jgi:hypothetical protein
MVKPPFKRVAFGLVILLFITMRSIAAFSAALKSDDKPYYTCPSEMAQFVPHPSENPLDKKKYDYTIDVNENLEYDPKNPNFNPYGVPVYFLTLKILDKITHRLITSFRMGLIYSGGATIGQYLDLSPVNKDNIHVFFLNKDFGHSGIGHKNFPYVIILPNVQIPFYRIHEADIREGSNQLQFFTEEKFFPTIAMPSVWVFNKCLNGEK